ncbi:ricin-type beta-trefoil lectin domain protein [Asticcacaulis sp. BYS171W]|uniref:Ricin-type beta-trefoil lectin domain protein n=1 Tax=Asticcacaulis aquaticus TaxID=2984212 RepID=A0ABT5HTU3_9CAUL|nr:RICIN domain-containing protein [Asticcacaulis aquaticus]MDC7683485.1 ricin-type beta-trefoil lectin domain protein [Asticcacaulis aquaticus]
MRISSLIAVAALAAGGTLAAGASQAAAPVVASGHATGKCIDIRAGSNDAILYGCHGGTNQQLVFKVGAYGQLMVNGKCLSTSPGDYNAKRAAPLIATTCNNSTAQRWANTSEGFLRNEEGWCADIEGASSNDTARIIAYTCEKAGSYAKSNQRWSFTRLYTNAELRTMGTAGIQLANQANNAKFGSILNTSGMVAAGGGNMVAAGGGNMVAAGGGNMVAAGGGNLLSPQSGMVAAGGGN